MKQGYDTGHYLDAMRYTLNMSESKGYDTIDVNVKRGYYHYDEHGNLTYRYIDWEDEETEEKINCKSEKKCVCSSRDLFNFGCRCGFMEGEK